MAGTFFFATVQSVIDFFTLACVKLCSLTYGRSPETVSFMRHFRSPLLRESLSPAAICFHVVWRVVHPLRYTGVRGMHIHSGILKTTAQNTFHLSWATSSFLITWSFLRTTLGLCYVLPCRKIGDTLRVTKRDDNFVQPSKDWTRLRRGRWNVPSNVHVFQVY